MGHKPDVRRYVQASQKPAAACNSTLIFAIAGIFLFISVTISAQPTHSNDTFLDSAINRAVTLYTSAIGRSARLYNGTQYKDYEIHDYDVGHPYFQSDDWLVGSIRYDGETYTRVYAQYNLIQDRIIIENPYYYTKIDLIQEKVKSFSLAGHDFVKLSRDSSSVSQLATGFYEVLYNGHVKVYAKRSKEIVAKIENGIEKKTFKEKNRYFIYKNNVYFPVSNKSSVLKVFADRKTMLRTKLADRKIVFNRDRSLSIAQIARLYDESENTL